MIADYEDMLAQGMKRQEEQKSNGNKQIRDTYMNKLNIATEGTESTANVTRITAQSEQTTDSTRTLNSDKKTRLKRDDKSPVEAKRVTL